MALEKPTNMQPKQKITLFAIVIVLLIVIWQVIGLFKGKSHNAPVIKPATMSAKAPAAMPMNGSAPGLPSVPNAPTPAGATVNPPVIQQSAVSNDPAFMKMQRETAAKNIDALNQLETLKIERQIAETNQAIATARLATVTAQKSIDDILVKPIPQPVPPETYANKLVTPVPAETPNQNPPQQQANMPAVTYTVISVSMQLNKWSAVIGQEHNLYSVGVGDTLPPDGSVVVSIDKNGVVIMKDNVKTRLPITSAI